MERLVETRIQLSSNFDHRTIVEYILSNLPNASSQILGDAEAVFHELHFNDLDKEATFAGLVASGGIDAERFEAAYDLLEKTHVYKLAKESEGLLGAEQQTYEVSRELGELALSQVSVEEQVDEVEQQPVAESKSGLIILERSDGIDLESGIWQDAAICKSYGPEAFFPEKGGNVAEALRICAACTVTDECRTFAINNREPFGVWGGTTEHDRAAIFKRLDHQERMKNRVR